MEKSEIKTKIREKLAELAGELGNDVSQIRDDDIIPATGIVDSAGVLGEEDRRSNTIRASGLPILPLSILSHFIGLLACIIRYQDPSNLESRTVVKSD